MRRNEIILHHKLYLKLKWRIMDINEKYLVTYDYTCTCYTKTDMCIILTQNHASILPIFYYKWTHLVNYKKIIRFIQWLKYTLHIKIYDTILTHPYHMCKLYLHAYTTY